MANNKHFVVDTALVEAHIYEPTYYVPQGVRRIGAGRKSFATYNKEGLETVVIPNSVVEIYNSAFSECRNLQDINFPTELKTIGDGAFYHCVKIETLNIPDCVSKIGKRAFSYCDTLKVINVPAGIKRINEEVFRGCSKLESIVLPESVEKIGKQAFKESAIKSIDIPANVTTIEDAVFGFCSNLNSVYLPNNIQEIGEYAFIECVSLEHINIPPSVRNIGKKAFMGCKQLKNLYLADHITIDNNAFADCPQLTIYSGKGGFSEKYANENNIPFVEVPKENLILQACKNDRPDLLKRLVEKVSIPKELFDNIFLTPAKEKNAKKCIEFLTGWKTENI